MSDCSRLPSVDDCAVFNCQIAVRTVLFVSPTQLDAIAKHLRPGDTVQILLDWVELTSPDLVLDEPIRIDTENICLL
jgi:protein involved in polysaccharide export with SLBB domain